MKQPNPGNDSTKYKMPGRVGATDTAWQPANRKLAIGFIVVIIIEAYLAPLLAIMSSGDHDWYMSLFSLHATIAYSLIVLGVIMFGDSNLEVFHDHFSAWTIVLSCFITASLSSTGIVSKSILAFLGILLSVYILVKRKSFRVPTLRSVMVSLLWTAGTVLTLSVLRVLLDPRRGTLPSALGQYLLGTLILQIPLVTAIEEAYFRGLIYGLLIFIGLREDTALVFQAILFFGSHYLIAFTDPLLFFVLLPVYTIFASIVIKKHKMLYMPIMMHTANNVLGGILSTLL